MNMGLGESLRVTLRGSSHGPFVGALVEGMPEGLVVDDALVDRAMKLRKTGGTYSSKRKEDDLVEWRTGVVNGITTGEAIEVHIANQDARSSDYSFLPDHPRPGHQDMVMMKRTNGEADAGWRFERHPNFHRCPRRQTRQRSVGLLAEQDRLLR